MVCGVGIDRNYRFPYQYLDIALRFLLIEMETKRYK
jgi:hypothetical protein